MAVEVKTDPLFKSGEPRELFNGMYFSGWDLRMEKMLWDIHPKDGRFLMIKPSPIDVPRKINIVLNWFEELKERAPVD